VNESAQVDQLIATVRESGTTVLLVSHDIDQMFRLADRIVVLRRGRIAADVNPAESHPEDIVALISGQPVDSSARRQLSRLHGLADQLASAEPSSSLPLIVSALAGALGAPGCAFISSTASGCASRARWAFRTPSPTRGRTYRSMLPVDR